MRAQVLQSARSELKRFVVIVPVFNDWVSASRVCELLDEEAAKLREVVIEVLLIDDGSPQLPEDHWREPDIRNIAAVRILRLRANLGHQRAICIGLCYVVSELGCDWALVMDGDGEDRPEDAIRLINAAITTRSPVLFAERRRRTEGTTFQTGYFMYRLLHRILTGRATRVGNFSVVSWTALQRLTIMPELWNHYAGTVFRSTLACRLIPTDRGTRIHGESKMNLVSLVTHGISAIASFQEHVATRILVFNVIALLVLIAALCAIVAIRFWTNLAIAGWATYTAGIVIVLLVQSATMSFNLMMTVMSQRTVMTFIPLRGYRAYIDKEVLACACRDYVMNKTA